MIIIIGDLRFGAAGDQNARHIPTTSTVLSSAINWLDQPLPFRRRNGEPAAVPVWQLTDGHHSNPVVGLDAGHVFLEWGCLGFIRHLLQLALADRIPVEGADPWLRTPPSPAVVRQALEQFRPALSIDDSQFPAFQVRPEPPATSALSRALVNLLPSQPTSNAVSKGTSLFDKGMACADPPLAAGLTLPLLYAIMVMFPLGAGGGQHGLPAGGDALQILIV